MWLALQNILTKWHLGMQNDMQNDKMAFFFLFFFLQNGIIIKSAKKRNAINTIHFTCQIFFVKICWSASHMFSSVAHSTNVGSLHAVPHCKEDKSMIKMVYNTIPIGFIKGEI